MFPICGWTNRDNQPLVIGFAGKARSGKDTAGKYLVDEYQFLRYSFAQPLKDATKIMFHLTDKQIENKEKPAEPWGRSPRELYQKVGTDIARNIDVNVWVKGAEIFKVSYEDFAKQIEKNFERLFSKAKIQRPAA